jgi:putative proteasome-type protease
MTFGIGIKVREGIVALADTQIVVGSERVSKQKLAALYHANDSMFAMTSGLRSVRDKSLTYLSERLRNQVEPLNRLFRVVNMFGEELRKVREEDGPSLARSNISFNTHAIIGGCLAEDTSPQLFYVYPEGNWIEAAPDSPYFIIGRTSYGKPILDRLLRFDTPLRTAVALSLLAFDATRASVTDVDCPIDIAVIAEGNRHATFHRFTQSDISMVTEWWSRMLSEALTAMPMQWADVLFKDG